MDKTRRSRAKKKPLFRIESEIPSSIDLADFLQSEKQFENCLIVLKVALLTA